MQGKDEKANFGVIFWRVGRLQRGFLVIITQDKVSDKKQDNIWHTFLHVSCSRTKEKGASIGSVRPKE